MELCGLYLARTSRLTHLWKIAFLILLGCACGLADNPIQTENAKTGTADWRLVNPATNREIEGYASLTSVNVGSKIDLFVSTGDPTFSIQVFRSGWYGGLGARLMTTTPDLPGIIQQTPNPDPKTGLIDCHWAVSFTLSVPTTWTSGIYLARLTGKVSGKQSYIIFVVRDDSRSSDLVFESSVTTFEAYNFWPGGSTGKSLYDWAPGGRGWKVSFNRPYVLGYSYTASSPGAASGVGAGEYLTNLQPGPNTTGYPIPSAGFEYNMVRWLEKNGYDVTYMTDLDMHENAALLRNHKAFLSVGHNEYWSMPMVKNLQSALAASVNAGFFSANTMYWQIRLEADAVGNSDRTMVCYKNDAVSNDPMYSVNPELTTTTFRDDPVGMPEAGIIGVEYVGDPVNADIVITNASHWLLNGTGLQNGDHLRGLLGYEVDSYVPGLSPGNTVVLASSPIGFPDDINNPPGFDCQSTECNSNMTWYSTGKSSVFATGSMYWSWGLDDFNAPNLRPSYLSAPAQQLTRNVLAALINSVVITTSPLPNAVVGTAYTPYQLTIAEAEPPCLWSATNLPAGMVLSSSGLLSGTPVSSGTTAVSVSATDNAGHLATALFTLVVQPAGTIPGGGSLSVAANALPFATTGAPYTHALLAIGGTTPYQWSLANGALPLGLTLTTAGQITGTPQNVGSFPFTPQATDAAAQNASHAFQLVSIGTVDGFLANSSDTTRWCQCILDQAPGSQDPQVLVQQGDGQLSIIPLAGLSGMRYNGYGSLTALDMTDAALSVQTVQAATGHGYTDTSFTLSADARNWYRFVVEGGSLYLQSMVAGVKSGVAIPYDSTTHVYWRLRHSSATGRVFFETSGTGASWTIQWQVSATVPVNSLFAGLNAGTWDSDSNTGQAIFANLRWEQNACPPLPYISTASGASGIVGTTYSDTLFATAGTSPYAWSVVSGTFPPGLTLSPDGSLSGVPTSAGTFRFAVQVKDAAFLTASHIVQITIAPGIPLTVSTAALPNGTVRSAYSQTFASSGGTAPYQWSLLSGALPTGLTLNASGQLTGTPTTAGLFNFAVQVKDNGEQTAARSLQMTVTAQTYSIAGRITQSGSGLAGVTVSLNGSNSTTTSSTGAFSFAGLAGGTYTVGATLSGFTFSPPTQTFANITANQTANFTAVAAPVTPRAISINFVGNGTPMGSAETAGVIAKAYWNNAVGNASTAVLKLLDENNTATAATLTWKADNTWSTPVGNAPGNTRMMNGYLDTASGNPITATISGLSASATGYDVYVYFDADNGSGAKTITYSLSGAGVTKVSVIGIDAANQNYSSAFNLANGTAGNYVKFTTQATTFTLTATPKQASDSILRAAINGIQVIPH